MKGIIIAVLACLTFHFLQAQEFSFEMYFEDALGNRDTVVLGYDTLGTDSIDVIFAEQSVRHVPKDSNMDVRIVQYIYSYNPFRVDDVITRKQILPKDCDNRSPFVISRIEITTDNWPVTATWDNSLFVDSCHQTSLFTSVNPGGWFDTGSPSNLSIILLKDSGSVTFTSQVTYWQGDVNVNNNYAYLDNNSDTVSVFWFTFNYDFSIGITEESLSIQTLKVFPNPATNHLYFEDIDQVRSVVCYTAHGQQVAFELKDNSADVSQLQPGVYFLQVVFANGQRGTGRFVKQ